MVWKCEDQSDSNVSESHARQNQQKNDLLDARRYNIRQKDANSFNHGFDEHLFSTCSVSQSSEKHHTDHPNPLCIQSTMDLKQNVYTSYYQFFGKVNDILVWGCTLVNLFSIPLFCSDSNKHSTRKVKGTRMNEGKPSILRYR